MMRNSKTSEWAHTLKMSETVATRHPPTGWCFENIETDIIQTTSRAAVMISIVQLASSSHPASAKTSIVESAEAGLEPARRAGFGEAENGRLSVN